MENILDLNTPLTYNDWTKYKETLSPNNYNETYSKYLFNWYDARNKTKSNNIKTLRDDYIQLLKDLSFLFGKDRSQLFLSEIDFKKDEDLVYSIPFFVRKLKEIGKVLSNKRESIKNVKQKYSLIGSNVGLESLLYEYILKGFTRDENNISQIPISILSSKLPSLSSVNESFFVEVEELHDSQSYHDSDPSVPIEDYVDVSSILNEIPFEDMSEEEILQLISTRYMSRIAETPLSRLFANYLSEVPTLSTIELFNQKTISIRNQIEATKQYLGEPVWGLTAVKVNELANNADYILNLDMEVGNNWFYWPSSDKITNTVFNNTFIPININDSNFVNSGATGGSDYTNSDLFFSDKVGVVEGAWLQGPRVETSKGNLNMYIDPNTEKEFIFPYPGFDIKTKGTRWGGYTLNTDSYRLFKTLSIEQQDILLKEYYTNSLPNSASRPIYLNDSTLVYSGAYASLFSDDADTITKRNNTPFNTTIYNSESESAYLYKFTNTDIPISIGSNEILWPIQRVEDQNIPITVLNDTCNPVRLSDVDVKYSMRAAVAGFTPQTSDIIYKLNTRNDDPIDAAWLGSGSIQRLSTRSTLTVYNDDAKYCAKFLDGPVQYGLNIKVIPKGRVSFIWMGPDTYADDVFYYRHHAEDCPYLKTSPHNYYSNQDYINQEPISSADSWKSCRCKSVNYSPIGHSGDKCTDYNRMSDFLFADPQGLGPNFAFNSWIDTRGLNAIESPQFSHFRLDGDIGDSTVGWGSGKWVSSRGKRMILKSGRRYTYYRTSLRSDIIPDAEGSANAPYLVTYFPYQKLDGVTSSEKNDIVILLDRSFSQRPSFSNILKVADELITSLIYNNPDDNVQIGIVAFDHKIVDFSYLSRSVPGLKSFLDGLSVTNRPKSIYNALVIANTILNKNINTDIELEANDEGELYELCSSLDDKINVVANNDVKKNAPDPTSNKNIIILSDGYENLDVGKSIPYARTLINNGINIFALDIGPNSSYLDFMENVTKSENYYDVQKFLKETDNDVNSFVEHFSQRFKSDLAFRPTWYKMIREANGAWMPTSIPTDMVLEPGDYITYIHRGEIQFSDESGIFITPTPAFTFNVKLYGWDYSTNKFNDQRYSLYNGAKPFWAKVYSSPEFNYDNHFDKQYIEFGGQVRFVDGYLPVHQPELSNMVLNNSDFITYNRRSFNRLNWNQPLTFDVLLSSYEWKKLEFFKDFSNLAELFRHKNFLDLIAFSTNERSDILLEETQSSIKSKYNYFARNIFNYTENLYYISRCYTSYAIINSAIEIVPNAPYKNLTNIHFPTIANISFPSLAVSEKEVGSYMLPEKLGVSHWRGKGYEIQLDLENLSDFDTLSAERMFLNVNKYSDRHRGLTKRDQRFPLIVSNIDNRWMFKSYRFSENSGTITDTLNNQKFTPYQSKFEITKINDIGISRIYDDFDFWNIPPLIGNWDSPDQYPLTLRKELTIKSFESRKNLLLTYKGDVTEWKTDMFGNNYSLYKKYDNNLVGAIDNQIQNSSFPNPKF